ncbi:MAG: MFS transporter, partial [Janthinobacterium sp.]
MCVRSSFIEPRIFSSFFQYCAHYLRGDGSAASVNFRRLWFSNGLNCFGAQITSLALPLCAVLLLHATPEQMGVLVALQALPFALFGLPVGVLLD